MTEDEAKTKWCPFARTSVVSNNNGFLSPAFNRTSDKDGHEKFTPCIASSCMAWRWAGSVSQYPKASDVPGYCGLSGAPQ